MFEAEGDALEGQASVSLSLAAHRLMVIVLPLCLIRASACAVGLLFAEAATLDPRGQRRALTLARAGVAAPRASGGRGELAERHRQEDPIAARARRREAADADREAVVAQGSGAVEAASGSAAQATVGASTATTMAISRAAMPAEDDKR